MSEVESASALASALDNDIENGLLDYDKLVRAIEARDAAVSLRAKREMLEELGALVGIKRDIEEGLRLILTKYNPTGRFCMAHPDVPSGGDEPCPKCLMLFRRIASLTDEDSEPVVKSTP